MSSFVPFKASDSFNMETFNSKLQGIADGAYEIGDIITTTRQITDLNTGGARMAKV